MGAVHRAVFPVGLVVAIFVTRVFRLPTVELSGRINVAYAALFVVQFLFAVLSGAISVTLHGVRLPPPAGTAITRCRCATPTTWS